MPILPYVVLLVLEYLFFRSLKPQDNLTAFVYLAIAMLVLLLTVLATLYFGFWLGMIVPALESGQCGALCFLG